MLRRERGGVVDNVFVRNVEIGRVREAGLTIDFLYETGAVGPYKPMVRQIVLENVKSAASPRVLWIVRFPGAVIEDVRFVNCTFRGVEATEVLQNVGAISFKSITIEPARKAPTRNSRSTWP